MIAPGTTIGGFRVEGLLGKGGMASVYRAIQLRLDRPVALKVLNPALGSDEQFFLRFQQEGINAARLEHPHIVPVYEAGEGGGFAFMAMKLVEGETFGAVIARKQAMTTDEALPILRDIARALEYAHGMGFVHRDVKPGNVLIERSGHVYLSDFGLSKDLGSRGLTSTGQWMGTAEYMAPEQASGLQVDYRADLYALGCVAFECLTGDPPYLGDSPLAVMMAHATHEVPSATALNTTLAPGVDAFMQRAMAKDRDLRYQSASALVEALQAAVEGQLVEVAKPEPEPEPAHGPPPEPEPEPEVVAQLPTSAPPNDERMRSRVSTHPSPTNLFCPRCIGQVDPEDVFCGGCGARILWCQTCRGPLLETDRFCQHCGATSTFGRYNG